MTSKHMRFVLMLLTVVVAVGVGTSLAQGPQRVYSVEGAWYGVVTLTDLGVSVPTLDTFTSNPLKPGFEGSFLCTVPAVAQYPNPGNPNGWTRQTSPGQGNWVRIGRNKYAFTAVRTIYDENGNLFGRAKNWGTITQVSKDEYTGTMNVQFYLADGTPTTPVFSGTLHSQRVAITFEQQP